MKIEQKQKLTLEERIMDKANFFYTCKYNGKEDIRICIMEALEEETRLSASQFCSLYGIFKSDYEKDYNNYIESIYQTMKKRGF